eukprot:Nk52_evm7s639 gene=Nk52_evmTU7s639
MSSGAVADGEDSSPSISRGRATTTSSSNTNANSNDAPLYEYEIGKTLGSGKYGRVRKARHGRIGQKVALKIIPNEKCSKFDEKEINSLKNVNHPNIVKLFDVIRTRKHLILVMELLPGGELFDYIVARHHLSEKEARKFMRQIISALDFIHRKGIVHRDLKLENLLLDQRGNVKIADFGFSNFYDEYSLMGTFVGSPAYAAPEILANEPYIGPPADLWSLGVILFTLVAGRLPFENERTPNFYTKVQNVQYHMPSQLSPECKNLLSGILKRNPYARLSMKQIMEHPWVNYQMEPLQPFSIVGPDGRIKDFRYVEYSYDGKVPLIYEFVEILETMGYEVEHLYDDLVRKICTRESAAYRLMCEKYNKVLQKIGATVDYSEEESDGGDIYSNAEEDNAMDVDESVVPDVGRDGGQKKKKKNKEIKGMRKNTISLSKADREAIMEDFRSVILPASMASTGERSASPLQKLSDRHVAKSHDDGSAKETAVGANGERVGTRNFRDARGNKGAQTAPPHRVSEEYVILEADKVPSMNEIEDMDIRCGNASQEQQGKSSGFLSPANLFRKHTRSLSTGQKGESSYGAHSLTNTPRVTKKLSDVSAENRPTAKQHGRRVSLNTTESGGSSVRRLSSNYDSTSSFELLAEGSDTEEINRDSHGRVYRFFHRRKSRPISGVGIENIAAKMSTLTVDDLEKALVKDGVLTVDQSAPVGVGGEEQKNANKVAADRSPSPSRGSGRKHSRNKSSGLMTTLFKKNNNEASAAVGDSLNSLNTNAEERIKEYNEKVMGAFSTATTSSKPPNEVLQEILRLQFGVDFYENGKITYKCVKLKVELELPMISLSALPLPPPGMDLKKDSDGGSQQRVGSEGNGGGAANQNSAIIDSAVMEDKVLMSEKEIEFVISLLKATVEHEKKLGKKMEIMNGCIRGLEEFAEKEYESVLREDDLQSQILLLEQQLNYYSFDRDLVLKATEKREGMEGEENLDKDAKDVETEKHEDTDIGNKSGKMSNRTGRGGKPLTKKSLKGDSLDMSLLRENNLLKKQLCKLANDEFEQDKSLKEAARKLLDEKHAALQKCAYLDDQKECQMYEYQMLTEEMEGVTARNVQLTSQVAEMEKKMSVFVSETKEYESYMEGENVKGVICAIRESCDKQGRPREGANKDEIGDGVAMEGGERFDWDGLSYASKRQLLEYLLAVKSELNCVEEKLKVANENAVGAIEKTEYEKQVADIQKECEERANSQTSWMEKQLEEKNDQVDSLLKDIDRLESSLRTLQGDFNDASENRKDSERELNWLKETLCSKFGIDCGPSSTIVDQLCCKLTSLKTCLEGAEKNAEQVSEEFERNNTQLKTENEHLCEKVTSLEHRIKQLEDKATMKNSSRKTSNTTTLAQWPWMASAAAGVVLIAALIAWSSSSE